MTYSKGSELPAPKQPDAKMKEGVQDRRCKPNVEPWRPGGRRPGHPRHRTVRHHRRPAEDLPTPGTLAALCPRPPWPPVPLPAQAARLQQAPARRRRAAPAAHPGPGQRHDVLDRRRVGGRLHPRGMRPLHPDRPPLRAGRLGRIRLLRQPLALLLGAAAAPGVHPAGPAGRLRPERRQSRRAGGAAGHPCRRPGPAGPATRPDPHRRQELLRRCVRGCTGRAGRAAAAPGAQGRARTGRRAPVQAVAAGHRVDQPDLQGPARPGTPRRAHPGRRHRAGAAAHPRLDRCDLAQRPHRAANPQVPRRLRSLTPLGIDHLAAVLALVLVVGTAFALPSGPAEATTATTYDIAAATATPQFSCTEFGCGALTGYTYTGEGTCSAGCVGFPPGSVDVTLSFSVARTFPPSPCRMKSGTGTLEASWPDDPTLPAAQGTFTFNAHDSHAVVLAGSITSSSLSVLLPDEAIGGFVTFPPSPCTGGTAQAQVSFGG